MHDVVDSYPSPHNRDRHSSYRLDVLSTSGCRLGCGAVFGLLSLLMLLLLQEVTPGLERGVLAGFWRAVLPWLSGGSAIIFLISVSIVGWQVCRLWLSHRKEVARTELLEEGRKQSRLTTRLLEQAYRNQDNVKITHGDDHQIKSIEIIRTDVLLEQTRIQEAAKQARALGAGPRHAAQLSEPSEQRAARSSLAVDPRIIAQRKLIASIQVPTFSEALESGLIVPGQKEILICFELEVDEYTGELTGRLRQYQDVLSNNCTMFLGGGSKSGKSTLMAWLGAQEALMSALFYIIDPHLTHPEKSIAVKLSALSHAFILPPAESDADIRKVLDHAMNEAEARRLGKETPYSGRPIVVIIDEILNLFGRAQRKPEDKEIQALYRDLAFFMRDMGTQYNKYDVNGIFATQYLTKNAFKLPRGLDVDFRDACQNQTLLRLPPNQAQVMRLLQREELREMRALRPGFGFMGFATGDIIRMAAGNILKEDIEQIAPLVLPAPPVHHFSPGWGEREHPKLRVVEGSRTVLEAENPEFSHTHHSVQNVPGGRQGEPVVRAERGSEPVQNEFVPVSPSDKMLSELQQQILVAHYRSGEHDVKALLRAQGLGIGTYYHHACYVLDSLGLRQKRA
jgi:hypothetical protein